jgi:hypothetical protein
VSTFALLADISLAVAIAGAATGVALLLLDGDGTEESAPSTAFAPWIGPDAAGLAASGVF